MMTVRLFASTITIIGPSSHCTPSPHRGTRTESCQVPAAETTNIGILTKRLARERERKGYWEQQQQQQQAVTRKMGDNAEQKEYSMEEIATHATKDSTWIVIKDVNDGDTPKVYDVSSYLNDHPGGAEVVMEVAGEDATNMFEDIGHSSDAREEMKKHLIGILKLTEAEKTKISDESAKKAERAGRAGGGLNPLAVLFLLLAISIGYYYSQQA